MAQARADDVLSSVKSKMGSDAPRLTPGISRAARRRAPRPAAARLVPGDRVGAGHVAVEATVHSLAS